MADDNLLTNTDLVFVIRRIMTDYIATLTEINDLLSGTLIDMSGLATSNKQDILLAELELKANLTDTQPVSVSTLPPVTANAGLDLNTSALALEVGGNLELLVNALATLNNTINSANQQTVSIEDVAFMFKRMMQMLERPPYMNNLGMIKAELQQSNGTTSVTMPGANNRIDSFGLGIIDQTFSLANQQRDVFNNWKNNIIT